MGAWGHEPFANDTALDWLHPINTYIEVQIAKAMTDYLESYVTKSWVDGQYEMIAATELLLFMTNDLHAGHPLNLRSNLSTNELLGLGIECLTKLLDDPWVEEWGSTGPETQYREMLKLLNLRYEPV